MAKRVRVSSDGTNFYTLPGSQGEKRIENNSVDSTVFGQSFESADPTLGQGMVTANAKWKGVAGYEATLKKTGTSTVMTAEALSAVAGQTYQITASAKQVIDYESAITVYDNAIDHTADVESIDYLTGKVTFEAGYTVTGPVTVTGKYLPLAAIARARSFNATMTANEIDDTDYETAKANGGLRTFLQGLRNANLEIGGIYAESNDYHQVVLDRDLIVVEISPDGSSTTVMRGFFRPANVAQSGDVGALEQETLNLSLWVPDGEMVLFPYRWYFESGSKMNMAIRKCIEAWQTEGATITAQYLPDGTTGKEVEGIVTECSLSNTLEGLNEFSVSIRTSGAWSDVS